VEHAPVGFNADFQDIQWTKHRTESAAIALFTVHRDAIVFFNLWQSKNGFSA
jgi:hypothetical protein